MVQIETFISSCSGYIVNIEHDDLYNRAGLGRNERREKRRMNKETEEKKRKERG